MLLLFLLYSFLNASWYKVLFKEKYLKGERNKPILIKGFTAISAIAGDDMIGTNKKSADSHSHTDVKNILIAYFLEEYDFSGKTIFFCFDGGESFG